MVEVGELAPDFTVPVAGGEAYNDVDEFTLSEALGDGPVVLAFVPAAFTSACTEELCAFRDSLARFEELDARVYGLSVDLPFALNTWMREQGITFPMLSDWDHEVIHSYDAVLDDMYGVVEVARRTVFVLDAAGTVRFRREYPTADPDIDIGEIADAVEAARDPSGP
jgi:peroxiredoxin